MPGPARVQRTFARTILFDLVHRAWLCALTRALTTTAAAAAAAPRTVTTAATTTQVFGDGVYLGNDPSSFAAYGDMLVVCLVVVGHFERVYVCACAWRWRQ